MKRRSFLQSLGAGSVALAAPASAGAASAPPMKITRLRFYHNPASRPMINQSFVVST
jgi:hypothetical protein